MSRFTNFVMLNLFQHLKDRSRNKFGMTLLILIILIHTHTLHSALPQPNSLTLKPQDQALITKIEEKLNSITTFQAEFTQTSKRPNAQTQTLRGTFFLSRIKGDSVKFRFDYAPPPRIMIIGAGNNVMYFDNDAKQKTPLDLRQTPGTFLTKPRINFRDDYYLTQFKKGPKEIEIRIVPKMNTQTGYVDIRFSISNFALIGWRLVDMHAIETSVEFSNIMEGLKLNANMFKVLSPETGGVPKSIYEK